MGIAFEMKELTRNISSSHEDRRRRIGEIREEVNGARGEAQSLIMGLESFRQETNQQMKQDLAQDKARLKSETKVILTEVQDILKGFETSRKEANAKLKEDLSNETEVIRSEVKEMRGDAQKLIKGFSKSRQTVNSKMRKNLNISRVESKSEVSSLLENAQSLIKNLQLSRKETGSLLRRDLSKSKVNMESAVKQMLSDFGKNQVDVRTDLKEARDIWQDLASTMQAKRGVTNTLPKAEASLAKTEISDLETKIMVGVNEHPEGITLAGLADSLGVATIVLGRAAKRLLDTGKIRKDEKIYFPITSE